MTNVVRRIVSGNKARFRDDELKIELDLVYVTDRILIMGFPATGVEGLYRNHREDAIRFLQHRHGQNYWVFNFCPTKESSYDPAVFEGRVSRYPFPDHHAPPLAILPLATREIDRWLQGSEDRVAVLHCKAGKGRSGTMACAYLLAHEGIPSPPILQRSYSKKEWIKRQIHGTIEILPPDEDKPTATATSTSASQTINLHSPISERSPASLSDSKGLLDVEKGVPSHLTDIANPEISFTDALKGVLDLHTARRMKNSPSDDHDTSGKPQKVSHGVSIPSQKRFLYYWALLLSQEGPKSFWPAERVENFSEIGVPPFRRLSGLHTKVRLIQIKLRMRDSLKVAVGVVKAVNKFIDKTDRSGPFVEPKGTKQLEKAWASSSQIWVSLARYDDDLVELLEEWEVHTRDASGNLARKRPESMLTREDGLSKRLEEIFSDGKWDKQKMVRSFARLGVINSEKANEDVDKDAKIRVYSLRPITTDPRQDIFENEQKMTPVSIHDPETPPLQAATDPPSAFNPEQGIILDAARELRLRLYMGQIFLGWAWFIPAFHMSPSPSPLGLSVSSPKATLLLQREDIDFPIGIGHTIVDVEIEMEQVV